MFGLTAALQYYLYNSPTDMRKSFDGLCDVIQGRMMRNPVSGEVFIFINKRRDLMKILHWEYGGFVLYYKRLESGTFELPIHKSTDHSTAVYWPPAHDDGRRHLASECQNQKTILVNSFLLILTIVIHSRIVGG